jgi:hypothetical protein
LHVERRGPQLQRRANPVRLAHHVDHLPESGLHVERVMHRHRYAVQPAHDVEHHLHLAAGLLLLDRHLGVRRHTDSVRPDSSGDVLAAARVRPDAVTRQCVDGSSAAGDGSSETLQDRGGRACPSNEGALQGMMRKYQ